MLGYISEALSRSITQEDHVGGREARLALQEAWTRASTRCFWKSWYGEMAAAPLLTKLLDWMTSHRPWNPVN